MNYWLQGTARYEINLQTFNAFQRMAKTATPPIVVESIDSTYLFLSPHTIVLTIRHPLLPIDDSEPFVKIMVDIKGSFLEFA